MYPEIIDNVLLQELSQAEVSTPAPKAMLDVREQALIATFGQGVLNVEAGGTGFTWQPSWEDQGWVRMLNTDNATNLLSDTVRPSAAVQAAVRAYVENVQQHANLNPHTTGTSRYSFTDLLAEVVYEDALSCQLHNGRTAMVTVSSEMPIQKLSDPRRLFDEKHPSTDFWGCIINWFCSWEQHHGMYVDSYIQVLASQHHIPFVDLYPWPSKDPSNFDQAATFARQYLQAVNPLIITTHSEHVTALALGNWNHSFGLKYTSKFTDLVGIPELRTYGPSKDRDCAIILPSVHPGLLAHSGIAKDAAGRLDLLSTAIGWFATAEALKRSLATDNKLVQCKQIMAAIKHHTGPDTNFGKQLIKVKALYRRQRDAVTSVKATAEEKKANREAQEARDRVRKIIRQLNRDKRQEFAREAMEAGEEQGEGIQRNFTVYHDEQGIRIESRFRSWFRAKDEAKMIALIGMANGQPRSEDRRQQAHAVWELSVAAIQSSTLAGDTESDFVEWALRRDTGHLYYFEATSTYGNGLPARHSPCTFLHSMMY